MARTTRVRTANVKRMVKTRRILPTEELKSKMRPGRKKSNKPKEKEVRGKKFYWCHHHMAWGVHKPADCHVSQAQKDNKDAHQKKQVTAQAALATVIAPKWAALVANMTCNMADE